MKESRRRRGAKQDRREARRARKRQPHNGVDDVLITSIRKALAKHPLHLLGFVSYLIALTMPDQKTSASGEQRGTRALQSLVDGLAGRRRYETTALLAVLGEVLVDDEEIRDQCRREVVTRNDKLPRWIVGLPDVGIRGVTRRTDVFGDGDDLFIGLTFAGAAEATIGVHIDHDCLSMATTFRVAKSSLDVFLTRARETAEAATTFTAMDAADARAWLEYGIRWAAWFPQPDEWHNGLALIRWVIARLPGGGTARETPEWDARLIDGFFTSPAGAPFTAFAYRDLLVELCDAGNGHPSRWSPRRLSGILSDPWYDGALPLEIALDVPALLRAYVPFAHADSGIGRELTDEAIATIDGMSLRYRRELLEDAYKRYGDDDPELSRWLDYPDRAS